MEQFKNYFLQKENKSLKQIFKKNTNSPLKIK